MSHKATNWALQQRGLKPATKIVLFYLCDRHKPDFGCFPSQARLAEDCEMSKRSVQAHLAILEEMGFIRKVRRSNGGYYTSNMYRLAFEDDFGEDISEPCAEFAIGKNAHDPSAESACDRAQNLPTNPVMVNHVSEPVRDMFPITPEEILCRVVTKEAAASFIAFRKKVKKLPLTKVAAERIAGHLEKIQLRGGDPNDALAYAEERGWTTMKPDWYFDEVKKNGKRNSNNPADDPALRLIAEVARSV